MACYSDYIVYRQGDPTHSLRVFVTRVTLLGKLISVDRRCKSIRSAMQIEAANSGRTKRATMYETFVVS